MGADIEIDGHHALIRGPVALHGATLTGLDVRAGAAGTLAGLVADGETIVRTSTTSTAATPTSSRGCRRSAPTSSGSRPRDVDA
jgi:hypothetical protein